MPRFHRLTFFALALLSLLSPDLGFSAKSARPPASSALRFELDSPEFQRLENEEAQAFYEALKTQLKQKTDQKILAEFDWQIAHLPERGFTPREKPLRGMVFGPARYFFTQKREGQSLPPMNGEAAHVSQQFDFYYGQHFDEKGGSPKRDSILPLVVLEGSIFVRCEGKKECTPEVTTLRAVSIQWEYPSSGRGANSSAGGAGQN